MPHARQRKKQIEIPAAGIQWNSAREKEYFHKIKKTPKTQETDAIIHFKTNQAPR
jgi:hypothetical protein